jgi:PPM family protein phosphatase
MAIKIFQPISFSELGQRDNNEDYLFPEKGKADAQATLFLVCDGMGGLDKGELASQVVANTIAKYLMNVKSSDLDESLIQKAVKKAHSALELELKNDFLLNRLGSTLTLLSLNDRDVTVAHIGDSRVYHIRNGEILYRTRDHKQVLDMVADGIITMEQASTHPWRNRLSRSISVKRHLGEEESNIDDYFFICTDGVLEQVDDQILLKILTPKSIKNQQKLNQILKICEGKTKDNYSGYLLQIESIIDNNTFIIEQQDAIRK